jgi:ABC-type branched-subunit amino acid transport system substrate-binding protein
MAAVGCGSSADEGGVRTAVVAVVIPGGDDASASLLDVAAAVRDALGDVRVPGWTIEVATFDSNTLEVDELVEDDVVAAVGGLSSDVVRQLAPELADASILFVSPHEYDRVHTRGADPMTSVRPYLTYYTTAPEAADPLKLLANYATTGLGLESFAVVDAGQEKATQERREFTQYVRRNDADVPVSSRIADDQAVDVIGDAAEEGVDAIFAAGEPSIAAVFVSEARGAGLEVPLLVAPDLAEGDFVSAADGTAEDAISVRPATLRIDPGAAAPGGQPGPLAAASHDAGTAVGIVLERCLPAASSARDSREGCAGEMPEVAFDGVTGEVAFNGFGERLGGAAEIIAVVDGTWTSVG